MTDRVVKRQPLTETRRQLFLTELARHGVVSWAAIAASPHCETRKGAKGVFYTARARDPDFAAEWEAAIEEANDKLIITARERVINGVPRLRTYKDELIYVEDPETGERVPLEDRTYDSRLMELLLKGAFPDLYMERRLVEHINKPQISGWTVTRDDLVALSPPEREQLMAIISKVRDRRRETLALEHHPEPEIIDVTPHAVEPSVMPDPETGLLPWEQN